MKFKKIENLIFWINLLVFVSPVLLIQLPWASMMANSLFLIVPLFVLLILIISGCIYSVKHFKNNLKQLTVGQKVFLLFPIINLLLLVLLVVAVTL